jgi:hypothetical protein
MDRLLDNFRSPAKPLKAADSPIEHTPGPVTLNSTRHGFATGQCTSFQYSFFISQASQVKSSRNSTTQTPRERRADWVGSPT